MRQSHCRGNSSCTQQCYALPPSFTCRLLVRRLTADLDNVTGVSACMSSWSSTFSTSSPLMTFQARCRVTFRVLNVLAVNVIFHKIDKSGCLQIQSAVPFGVRFHYRISQSLLYVFPGCPTLPGGRVRAHFLHRARGDRVQLRRTCL